MSRVKLGDVAREHKEIVKGDKSNYPIVGLEHLIPENIRLTQWDCNKENTFTKVFRKGCVLFGRRRAYLKKAAYADFDGICSGDITVIEAIPGKILPELLPFVIQNDDLFDYAVGKSAGSLSPRVKWEYLKNYEFELPDIERQHELAKILWSIVETKESYERLMAATDELVKSQFIELFKDCLNQKPLTEICSPKQWKTIGTKDFTSEGYPVYGANGLIGKYKEFNHDKPTVMIGCRGTCGVIHVSEGKSYINGNAMCLDDPIPEINYKYLSAALKCYDFSKIITGTSQPQITIEGLKKVLVKIPTLEEQKVFISLSEQSDKSKFHIRKLIQMQIAIWQKGGKIYANI